MKLLGEFETKDVQVSTFDLAIGDVGRIQVLKIIGMGELNAQGNDRRFMLRSNSLTTGYMSYAQAEGHYDAAEWEMSGFYLGRSGFLVDATFTFEYTLTFIPGGQRINGHGTSTFAHANNLIIGYEEHGYVGAQSPVKKLELIVTGGLIRQATRVYAW
jgi:hypothetical protein